MTQSLPTERPFCTRGPQGCTVGTNVSEEPTERGRPKLSSCIIGTSNRKHKSSRSPFIKGCSSNFSRGDKRATKKHRYFYCSSTKKVKRKLRKEKCLSCRYLSLLSRQSFASVGSQGRRQGPSGPCFPFVSPCLFVFIQVFPTFPQSFSVF